LVAAQARAQAQSSPQPVLFNLERVADGVYAAIARPQALLNSNAAIFENANDLLIVDAHSKPSAAAALAAQIKREITTKPIRYIVNTHFHWDHSQGDPGYRHMDAKTQFVTSSATRDLLQKLGASRAAQSVEQAKESLEGYRQKLGIAKTVEERTGLEDSVRQVQAYVKEMQNYSPELPDITFDQSLVLHDRARELHLSFRGRGHTAGDVVVFCPKSKVVATGDLLHGWFPFIADGYPREWPKTLARIGELPFETVVGGHGGVQQGTTPLHGVAAYLEELTEVVGAKKQQGQTVAEVQASVTPDQLRSLSGDYRSFLVSQRADNAQPVDEMIAAGVKSNVADVFERIDAS
jgi:glyoxylase-like metal-dependent hydrolase (beta-lactamase superfamily II)